MTYVHTYGLLSAAMERQRVAKFRDLMSVIDLSGGFYSIPVERQFCSHVNIPFRIAVAGVANSDLEARFLSEAAELGLVQLKVTSVLSRVALIGIVIGWH